MKLSKVKKLNTSPKISIILPHYNNENFVEDAIKSVKQQTYKNWELLIIDGNSNLKSKKIISRYKNNKKIKITWVKSNNGAGFNRNLGIKKSKSDYVAFIDSDDIWEKNKLKKQIKFMIKNKCKFSYTGYKTIDINKKMLKKIDPPLKYNFETFIKDTTIATSTMIVKRNILKNIKFTNTSSCDDYYFKCKILKKIGFALGIRDYLTNFRISKNSTNSKKLRNAYWVWKINRKFNKLNFFDSFISLFFISFNSIRKYGLK